METEDRQRGPRRRRAAPPRQGGPGVFWRSFALFGLVLLGLTLLPRAGVLGAPATARQAFPPGAAAGLESGGLGEKRSDHPGPKEGGASSSPLGDATLETVDVSVEPATAVFELLRGGSVTVTLHAGDQRVIGAEFDLRFDPNVLRAVDAMREEPGVQVEPVGPFTFVLGNWVETVDGQGRVVYGAGTLSLPVSGEIPVAVLHLRGVEPAVATELSFVSADVTDQDARSVVGALRGGVVSVRGELISCYLPLVKRAD
jgi:hypothetical protein